MKTATARIALVWFWTALLALSCRPSIPVVQSDPAQATAAPTPQSVAPLRLIVQITVDQLRGDSLNRHAHLFGEGGFRRFMDDGLRFENAHHPQAHTVTVVGHTNLGTGAAPSEHGMVANNWFDAEADKVVANINDANCSLLPKGETGRGSSATNILTDTFADALAIHTASFGKRFAVSIKDRGAVPLAGHTGKAFWFSSRTGRFVTSSCYYRSLPAWAQRFNDSRISEQWVGKAWELHSPDAPYLFADRDRQPWEADIDGFGTTFPHPFPAEAGGAYFNLVTLSPMGNQLLAAFAEELLEAEKLGQDDVPDFLSVSFSPSDYIGHYFGPSSLEYEDNLVHLDATLAALFATIERKVGLAHTLFVLSSDHGTPDAPEWLKAHNVPSGRLNTKKIDQAPLADALQERFGVGTEVIRRIQLPWIYLDHALLAQRKLNEDDVVQEIARFYEGIAGIDRAVHVAPLTQRSPNTLLERQILRNTYPGRSGDIYLVPTIHWHVDDSDFLVALHGSPWAYDTWVPLMFTGRGIAPGRVGRRVETIDVAPTLSMLVGCQAPAGATGTPLYETLTYGSPRVEPR